MKRQAVLCCTLFVVLGLINVTLGLQETIRIVNDLPPPSCAVNSLPCPVPSGWERSATWNLTQSTSIQPTSNGYFIPAHPWGMISLDWTVANQIWYRGNTSNTTCEQTSIENCRLLKQRGLVTRCFIYHNMELALQWLESQRKVMTDPSKADYFLQYTDGNGHKLGKIYNEPISFGNQYFWDYRNTSAAKYFTSSIASVLSDPAVDGTFTDDVVGVPAEHPNVQQNTKMSNAEIQDLQYATGLASQQLIDTLALQGKANYQAFKAPNDGPSMVITSGNCRAFMEEYCQPSYQGRLMFMAMDTSPANKNQIVSAFLISRPPVGFLGWGWESGDEKWDNIFLLQVGEPKGICHEVQPGIFQRQYTQGTAVLNCNNWTASLPFPSLPHT